VQPPSLFEAIYECAFSNAFTALSVVPPLDDTRFLNSWNIVFTVEGQSTGVPVRFACEESGSLLGG